METNNKMQSNRLVVTLDKNMGIDFESGIQTIYKNSHLINDFVVRPSFLLEPTQTLWVTFQDDEKNPSVTLKSSLLERKSTVANSTKQVVDENNHKSQIVQTANGGYEYYLVLPDDVLMNAGTWYFSLEIREIPDSSKPKVYSSIKTNGIRSFEVFNSLAGAGANGSTPTDLDVAALYLDVTMRQREIAVSEGEAKDAAEAAHADAVRAENAVLDAKDLIDDAVETISKQATEKATADTQQAINDETERAEKVEGQLASDIAEETNRALNRESTIQASVDFARLDISTINGNIAAIKSFIPSSTTATNKLANEAFVNSSINNMAAFYITYNAAGDAFPNRASLLNATTYYYGGQVRVPTQNDYAIVLADESQPQSVDGNYPTARYSYQGGVYPNGQWDFQYIVNNTSLTQAQLNAMNSGITSTLVTKLNGIEAGAQKNPTNYVTTDTEQNITAPKYFAMESLNNPLIVTLLPSASSNAPTMVWRISGPFGAPNDLWVPSWTGSNRSWTLPEKSGTLATLEDIPGDGGSTQQSLVTLSFYTNTAINSISSKGTVTLRWLIPRTTAKTVTIDNVLTLNTQLTALGLHNKEVISSSFFDTLVGPSSTSYYSNALENIQCITGVNPAPNTILIRYYQVTSSSTAIAATSVPLSGPQNGLLTVSDY